MALSMGSVSTTWGVLARTSSLAGQIAMRVHPRIAHPTQGAIDVEDGQF